MENGSPLIIILEDKMNDGYQRHDITKSQATKQIVHVLQEQTFLYKRFQFIHTVVGHLQSFNIFCMLLSIVFSEESAPITTTKLTVYDNNITFV